MYQSNMLLLNHGNLKSKEYTLKKTPRILFDIIQHITERNEACDLKSDFIFSESGSA